MQQVGGPATGVMRGGPIEQVVSPVPRPVWDEVLPTDPGATALQTPEYFQAVLRAGRGKDASRLYVLADGRRLVLPLVRREPLPGVQFDAAFPPGYGHGSLLATGGLRADDVRTVLGDLQRSGATSTRIGANHLTAEQWSVGRMPGVVEVPRRVEIVDLAGGYDIVSRTGFRRRTRELVRKAERRGVEVERDTGGRLMPVFYRLFRLWVERSLAASDLPAPVARRVALRQEPPRKFETVAALLQDRCRVFIGWHEGRPVASLITLVHGQHATAWRGYMDRPLAAPVAANHLVFAAAIEDACRSGCRTFDLGQSGGKPELERFKQSFGAVPHALVDLRIERPALTTLRSVESQAERLAARLLSLRRRTSAERNGAPFKPLRLVLPNRDG